MPVPNKSDVVRIQLPKAHARLVRSADAKAAGIGMLDGYAALYNSPSPDYGGFREIIKPGAFARALAGQDDVRALVNHDASLIIGRLSAKTLRLFDDATGLRSEIDLPDTAAGRDYAVSVERGDMTQMSFQFYLLKSTWSEEKTPAGTWLYTRTIEEVELLDVSIVTYPYYPQTTVTKRALDEWHAERQPSRLHRARRLLQLASAQMGIPGTLDARG